MQFQAKDFDPTTLSTGCLAVGIYENGELTEAAAAIDKAGNGALSDFIGQEKFSGKVGATGMLHHSVGQNARRLLLVGLGKSAGEGISPSDFVGIAKSLVPHAKATNARDMSLSLAGIEVRERGKDWAAHQLAQQLTHGLWQYDQTKSQKAPKPALKKLVLGDTRKAVTALKQGLKTGQAVGDGANYARELGNLPGNICTPRYLAKQARALGRGEKEFSVSILSEKQMRELGMGSFLSVSAGSTEPGQMIIMEYRGAAKSQRPTALVGKGITFDTGGISLKPGAAMDEMKFDMCGAASVFGAMKALLALKPKINVVAVVAAAENMPAGNATKPGDIVTSMSGQTIEILNTDAEGRLVLCDALTYSKRYKPKAVVDVATLTGACVMALGSHAHGLYSNDDTLANELLAAGQSAEDKGWHMPLWDEYQKQLDSNFADMANIGGREAGSVTAACFLSRFTKDMRWAHLDVAGTAWNSGAAKGATGRPVPMLVNYLLENG